MSVETDGAIRATIFLATGIAWRFTDILLAKDILTKSEARATLYAIADGIRNDAGGTSSVEMTEIIASQLEEAGDRFKA